MKVRILPSGAFDANCVFIHDDRGATLVADPGAEADELDQALTRDRLTVSAYLLTHGHTDHLGALADLWKRRPAPVLIHPDDALWAFTPENALAPYYPAPVKPGGPFPAVADGSVFTFGELTFRVMATPGHTPGCVCYYFEKDGILISGDTLFEGSVGRTDLPGGDGRILADSLVKLAALPPGVRVIPGHGGETSIEAELRDNYFMQDAARSLARRQKNAGR
jgi:glyoxylase-like metal-dependent hydrolase (beta-lactamase superfamily II)